MPQCLIRPEADADLVESWLQVAQDSPEGADRLIDLIAQKCDLLARFPNMGPDRSELAPSLRIFPVGRYNIFYYPLQDGIEVIRVLHSKRDTRPDLF